MKVDYSGELWEGCREVVFLWHEVQVWDRVAKGYKEMMD